VERPVDGSTERLRRVGVRHVEILHYLRDAVELITALLVLAAARRK
jgi:hypothetical protein